MLEVDLYRMQVHGFTDTLTCSVALIGNKNKEIKKELTKERMYACTSVYFYVHEFIRIGIYIWVCKYISMCVPKHVRCDEHAQKRA